MSRLCGYALILAVGLGPDAPAQDGKEKPEAFTFLFWTDQEINPGKGGDFSTCAPTVEAINTIQSDFEKIIVITHIDELKDAFPTRIDVWKTDEGSQVAIR